MTVSQPALTPSGHPAAWPPERLLADCDVRRTRRSGPGGQHRNKVETAVVLRHRPTGIEAEGHERRSLSENRQVAIRRLRVKLALEVRRPPNSLEPVSDLWRSRCRGGRIVVSHEHADFPALLAEALDVTLAAEADVKAAALALGATSSQLVKFLKVEPQAFLWVNSLRRERSLPALK